MVLPGGVEFNAWLSDFKVQRLERDFEHHGQKILRIMLNLL